MIEPGCVSCNDVEGIHADFSDGYSHDALLEWFPSITVHSNDILCDTCCTMFRATTDQREAEFCFLYVPTKAENRIELNTTCRYVLTL